MPVLWVFDLGLGLSGFGLFVLDMGCTHRTLHPALQAQNTGFGVQRATEADLCGRTTSLKQALMIRSCFAFCWAKLL